MAVTQIVGSKVGAIPVVPTHAILSAVVSRESDDGVVQEPSRLEGSGDVADAFIEGLDHAAEDVAIVFRDTIAHIQIFLRRFQRPVNSLVVDRALQFGVEVEFGLGYQLIGELTLVCRVEKEWSFAWVVVIDHSHSFACVPENECPQRGRFVIWVLMGLRRH